MSLCLYEVYDDVQRLGIAPFNKANDMLSYQLYSF